MEDCYDYVNELKLKSIEKSIDFNEKTKCIQEFAKKFDLKISINSRKNEIGIN